MKSKDFLSISNLTPENIRALIAAATAMKSEGWSTRLSEKVLALLFEKPSLRHRASFEVAMRQLGGQCFYLSPQEVGLGQRESTADVARVLSGYVDCIAARTFSHKTLEELSKYSRVPVINSLSDFEHPCQALADLLTIYEKKGDLKGLNIAFIGDSNNVANSLVLAAGLTGMNFNIASPEGYSFKENVIRLANGYAAESGARVFCTRDPREQPEMLISYTRTSGRAWDRKTRLKRAAKPSRGTRSTARLWRWPGKMQYSSRPAGTPRRRSHR